MFKKGGSVPRGEDKHTMTVCGNQVGKNVVKKAQAFEMVWNMFYTCFGTIDPIDYNAEQVRQLTSEIYNRVMRLGHQTGITK